MGIFFWDFTDYNDIERQWICFVLNILVFIFTALALVRSLKYHKKIMFQTIPLTFNLLSTLVLLLLKLFQKGYQFDLIGYIIEIFTYFLFSFTFSVILVKIKKEQKLPFKIKMYMILFILLIIILIIMILLVSIKVIQRNCDTNLVIISIVTLICQILSYIPTFINGKRILKILNVKKKSTLTQTMLSQNIETKNHLSDQFTIERRRQIFIVIGIYTISLLIRCLLLPISIYIQNSDLIQCQQLQGIYIITSDYFFGQVLLILIQINQLLPHLIIPLAIYAVPMKSKGKKNAFIIENDQYNLSFNQHGDQDFDNKNQFIKSRVSSVISDKAQSPKRR